MFCPTKDQPSHYSDGVIAFGTGAATDTTIATAEQSLKHLGSSRHRLDQEAEDSILARTEDH